jgi:sugar-specific transcriptional regulator TrmB
MIEELIHYGLAKKEAELYILLLKTGEATVNRLADLAMLPRSTVYDVLSKLISMGLVTTFVKQNTSHFSAVDPTILLTMLEDKRQSVRKILPELTKLKFQIGDKPIVEVYQGKIAIAKLLDEILDNARTLKIIGSEKNAIEKIGYYPKKFRMKKLENKIKVKEILEPSREAKEMLHDPGTHVRFLASIKGSKEATFLFDDYVYHLILHEEVTGIKIKSKEHARATEILFDELWKHAVRVG